MNLNQILLAIFSVALISTGQLLFKWSAIQVRIVGSWMSWRVWITIGLAGLIYVSATLLWINLLRQVALNRAYVFMALSFVIVPIASYFIFGEPMTKGYLIGLILMIIGIIVTQLA